MKNEKFILLKKAKQFCLNIDNIVVNFPKKEYVIKEKILTDSLNILELIIFTNYDKQNSNRIESKQKILTKISMLDFYLEYLYTKKIINIKVFNKIANELNELSRLTYGWLKDESRV